MRARAVCAACRAACSPRAVLPCGLWLRLVLRRRVCCDCHDVGRACRGECARGGCMVRALGAREG